MRKDFTQRRKGAKEEFVEISRWDFLKKININKNIPIEGLFTTVDF